jgi:hypothetical protein
MSNEYCPEVLFAEMPATNVTEEMYAMTASQLQAVQVNPPVLRVPVTLEFTRHPSLNIYGDASNYQQFPNIGHC